MGTQTAIKTCDHTFNPWWGCVKVSPGCKNCYAERLAVRSGAAWGLRVPRRTFGPEHWREPLRWNAQAVRQGRRRHVFCASMADVFEDNPGLEDERQRLWGLIERTPLLTWHLLTKRPEHMLAMAPWRGAWPDNVWAMTTAENQEQAERRIALLLQVPAVVRGISFEPLLGPIDLASSGCLPAGRAGPGVHWAVIGGESGPRARPMHPDWASELIVQCESAQIATLYKQHGEWISARDLTPEAQDALYEERDERAPGAPRCKVPTLVLQYDGREGHRTVGGRGAARMFRVGRRAAGRTIIPWSNGRAQPGRTYDGMPEESQTCGGAAKASELVQGLLDL